MVKTGSKPINELVRHAILGDGAAFTSLWDNHIDALRQYLKANIYNLDDFYIEDICSKSFEKAFRQIGTYDPSKSQFLTWLKAIAYRTALDTIDSEKRYLVPLDRAEGVEDLVDSPLESIIRDEDRQQTRRYIDGLPEKYREIATKRLIDGMQYKEISEETGLELNTVRTRIRRAKAMIDNLKKQN